MLAPPTVGSMRLRYSMVDLLSLSSSRLSLTKPVTVPVDCLRSVRHSTQCELIVHTTASSRLSLTRCPSTHALNHSLTPSSLLHACVVLSLSPWPLSVDLPLDDSDAVRALHQLAGLSASVAGSGSGSGSTNASASANGIGAGNSAASRWSVRDLGASLASAADRSGVSVSVSLSASANGGSKERGDDWRDRAAVNGSLAAKRRWDGAGDRRLNGRYSERDRDRSRDERYGSEAVPAWFTGDASTMASSLHDGQWHTADADNTADDDALEPAKLTATTQQQTDEEATRFLIHRLGISPVKEADGDSGLSSLSDTRPAWAVQAERELAEHRRMWNSQRQHKQQQQRDVSGYDKQDERLAAASNEHERGGSHLAASEASLDGTGVNDVTPADVARAAALASAIASESEYDKLDAMLAERAKQQADTSEAEEGHSEEAKQRDETRDEERATTELSERHDERTAADKAQEFIIPSAVKHHNAAHSLPLSALSFS